MSRANASSVRSPAMPIALPPAWVISPTTASTPARSRSTTATDAPSRAKRNAPARPMPEAAAVTMPIFPSRRMVFSCGSPPPSKGEGLRRRALAVVKRLQRFAIGGADRVALDLESRGQLPVGGGKRLAGDRETPHPFGRGQRRIDPGDDVAQRLDKAGVAGKRDQIGFASGIG